MPTTQISEKTPSYKGFYFHAMLDMPCGLLLLQAPVLWLSGLPGPPEDSLRVPRDGGLLAPVCPPPGPSFDGAFKGSIWFADFDSFRPSVMKLPTTTCHGIGQYCIRLEDIICLKNQQHREREKRDSKYFSIMDII